MFLPPSTAVDFNKEENIKGCAAIYMKRYETKLTPRYDIIEIIVNERKVISLNHIENAF